MEILFDLGQKVKHVSDGEICEVLEVSAKAEGIFYKVSSKEFDHVTHTVLNGVKTVGQDELEAVEEEEEIGDEHE